ncbi:ABC transporter permease [Halobacteriovorax sp. GB3]|uniref:ABC transporter permease n=1 Tax=Halobacteriovorax sp. GB3 TaxID=2719615 RepID=UPI00235E9B9B|nr:ABC transporter permease [Halobacteriovorax sp. GB3]MDD0854456.1 ABC transporter permease [Halobacteriovorax sp. GB3]
MTESKIGKLLYSLLTIFLAVTLIFFIIRLSPGDPVERILGPEASLEEIEAYRTQLGLNLPVLKQYLSFLGGLVKGDLGQSLFKKKDVLELLKVHMGPTIMLAFLTVSISAPLGTLMGIWAGFRKSGLADNFLRIFSLLALSFPIFSLAPILVLIFSIKLNLLPVSEWTTWKHTILPVLTLVLPLSSIVSRVSRNKFLEERSEPWVQVLKAKGLCNRAVLFRLMKVCLPTILNIVAIQLSVVLAGTMISETIFDIPGMGLLLFDAISNRDYPIVQGVILYSTVIYMGVYFLIDFVNSIIDPRIKA